MSLGWSKRNVARLARGERLPDLPRVPTSWRERLVLDVLRTALRDAQLPPWVLGVRASTWAEDQCGRDLVVATDREPIGVQVWTDGKGLGAFRARHGWRPRIAVVRFPRGATRAEVLAITVRQLAAAYAGGGDAIQA